MKVEYQESIYFRSAGDSTLWVNLFVSSTPDWPEKSFTISQETDFPRQQATELTVNGSGRLAIKLRVPAWVRKGYTVRVNGVAQHLRAQPGTYATRNQSWTSGDTIDGARATGPDGAFAHSPLAPRTHRHAPAAGASAVAGDPAPEVPRRPECFDCVPARAPTRRRECLSVSLCLSVSFLR